MMGNFPEPWTSTGSSMASKSSASKSRSGTSNKRLVTRGFILIIDVFYETLYDKGM